MSAVTLSIPERFLVDSRRRPLALLFAVRFFSVVGVAVVVAMVLPSPAAELLERWPSKGGVVSKRLSAAAAVATAGPFGCVRFCSVL